LTKATVPKTGLCHLANDRNEYEVVCFEPAIAEIEGAESDWATRIPDKKNAQNEASLAARDVGRAHIQLFSLSVR
jgi:hypothetical protein